MTRGQATGPYAVEAQTTLPGALTVTFFVDGALYHVEGLLRYCLFGGDAACNAGRLGPGAHVIWAQAVARGTTAVLAEAQVQVAE